MDYPETNSVDYGKLESPEFEQSVRYSAATPVETDTVADEDVTLVRILYYLILWINISCIFNSTHICLVRQQTRIQHFLTYGGRC